MLIGNYNAQVDETNMASFCEIYELRSLINEPTCYKNPLNPSCIDLFLTNNVNSFQKTFVSETGLSDFHKLIGTMMKPHIPKQKQNIIKYRKYKHFNKNKFEKEILNRLSKCNKKTYQIDEFKELFITTLNIHVPLKTKFLRANHANFVSKELTKAIMLRSKLRNKYLIEKSEEARLLYKKQRNVCVFLLKKAKKEYYENLDLQNVTDTKRFWKTVKPVFGNKAETCNTVSLIEKSTVIKSEKALAKTFYEFFVNIVPNLDIDAYNVSEVSTSDTNSST